MMHHRYREHYIITLGVRILHMFLTAAGWSAKRAAVVVPQ